VEAKNFEIEMARRAVEEKAEQLALTSKYKSEFLANMSHELRTPLNSLLLLSKLLADNPQGNLNEKQMEFARTIHSAGSDLLSLINDILDLSKIESGTVSIELGDMPMAGLGQHMERTFRQLAADKGLDFKVEFDSSLPSSIRTDEKRLQQVVLNLLSNAFKFTAQGSVTLNVATARSGWSTNHPVLKNVDRAIEISVTDTGIGIPEDKQKLIFEAFQQADGTTSRKYGGTGLGLSISREIARLLGGELQVRSKPGEGSTFTLFIPLQASVPATAPAPAGSQPRYENSGATVASALPTNLEIVDDRDALGEDPFVLIVEDDPTFASILLDLAHEAGLKGVVSTAGAGTLTMARKLQPNAITLDLGLSDIDGFVLLDLLKHDPQTSHLPIHVISGADEAAKALDLGAFGVTTKPAAQEELLAVFQTLMAQIHRSERRVLIVGDAAPRRAAADALRDAGVQVEDSGSVGKHRKMLGRFDVILLSYSESAKTAVELAKLIAGGPTPPILVLSQDGDAAGLVAQAAESGGGRDISIVSGLEELAPRLAFSSRRGRKPINDNVVAATPRGPVADELRGAKVLIVDDDIRNIYSLTSVLETYGVEVLHAERGRDGITILENTPGIDVALIDIMMPEMDGYETMQQIRANADLAGVPLVAVTAKAMKGDRQKCLDAGASDYIAKPVDIELMLALLRVWIARSRNEKPLVGDFAEAAAE
jgi:CheY-like chemotaxis protein/nitrogen-specific signal transduction histidine kinase